MIFLLLGTNPFSPFSSFLASTISRTWIPAISVFRRYEARELLPHDRGKYFSSVDAWRGFRFSL